MVSLSMYLNEHFSRKDNRSALLDALDAPTVLEREREPAGRKKRPESERETGRAGNNWAAPEYCIGKPSSAGRAGRRPEPCG
ncbi:UNVERIFIED_CONTAM: hypothetical protein FKN15_071167 [Acipenser sinensis]